MAEKKLKVLHFPKWYPNRNSISDGLFIKKHILALTPYVSNAVLFVASDEKLKGKIFDLQKNIEDEIFTVRVFYKKVNSSIPFISSFIKFYRNLVATQMGYSVIKNEFGNPDILHEHILAELKLFVLYLKLTKRIPYLITEHWSGYLKEDGTYRGFFLKLITKLKINFSSGVVVVSEYLQKAMEKHGLKAKFHIIPNVVEKNFSREKIKLQNGIIKILMVSDLINEIKNISSIILAFEKVTGNFPNLELHLVGEGKDRKKLEALSEKSGLLNKKIFFHGEIQNEKVYSMMYEASFLVNFSFYETFSVATAEAIANGLPVIATNCGGTVDYVNPENGLLVNPNNIQELEQAMIWMIENHKKFDTLKMSENILSKFNKEVIGKKLFHLYKKKHTLI